MEARMDEENFHINTELLIEAVGSHPELWDPSSEEYKDKFKRNNAWTDICSRLISDFNEKSKKEKEKLEKIVTRKWLNLRDYYRNLKRKEKEAAKSGSGRTVRAKYIHADRMSFLDDTLHHRETEDSLSAESPPVPSPTISPDVTRENFSKKRKVESPIKTELIKFLKSASNRNEDEDDHFFFFKSLLPQVRRLSAEKVMDFRINTMTRLSQLLKPEQEGFSNSSFSDDSLLNYPDPQPSTSFTQNQPDMFRPFL